MSLTVIPLASRIHGVEYCENLVEKFRKVIKGVEFTNIVFSEGDIDVSKFKENEAIVLLFLTGGTSKLGYKIASEIFAPTFLVSHGYHNSLGSALSCRARLRKRGLLPWLVHVDRPEGADLNYIVKAVEACASLAKAKFGVITPEGELTPKAIDFSSKTGIRVVGIDLGEVLAEAEAVSEEEATKIAEEELGVEYPDSDLIKCINLFIALKKIVEKKRIDAITMECFEFILEHEYTPCIAVALMNKYRIPFACEEDYYSLALMYLSKQLICYPGWIANPSGIEVNKLVLAHCTVDLSLIDRFELVSHFESGKPYAVKGELLPIEYTMARMSESGIECYSVKVYPVKKWSNERCRTQCSVEVQGMSALEFLEKASGNHHVLIPGKVEEHLKVIDWMMYGRWKVGGNGGRREAFQ